jgi:trehalose 6-phosphate phosphatase
MERDIANIYEVRERMTAIDSNMVLSRRPLGLVFDIDGTLSPIVPTPDEARLYPGVGALLEQLKARAHVAIMTGRAVADGARIVNIEGLTYIGTHGLEWCDGLPTTHAVQIIPEAKAYADAGKRLLDLVEQHSAEFPGIIVQRKCVGGSIHYRLANDPEQTRTRILELLQAPAQRLHMKIGEGKRVIEVLSPLHVDKGQALRRYVERFKLSGVVFAGDDRTDLYAMQEVEKLRQEGLAAVSIAVRHPDTLPDLLEHADEIVDGVEGMAEKLQELVDRLIATPL